LKGKVFTGAADDHKALSTAGVLSFGVDKENFLSGSDEKRIRGEGGVEPSK